MYERALEVEDENSRQWDKVLEEESERVERKGREKIVVWKRM